MKQTCCGFFSGVLLAILVLIVWFLSSVAITEQVTPQSKEFFLLVRDAMSSGLGAAFGAAAGALLAFKLSSDKDNHIKDKEKISILNNALIFIALQINANGNIKKLLDQYPSKFQRAFCMPLKVSVNPEHIHRVNLGELASVISDSPQLIMLISLAHDGLSQTILSLSVRNEFYAKNIQPTFIRSDQVGADINEYNYQDIFPEGLVSTAFQITEQLNRNVIDSAVDLNSVFSDLRKLSLELYPGQKFTKLESE